MEPGNPRRAGAGFDSSSRSRRALAGLLLLALAAGCASAPPAGGPATPASGAAPGMSQGAIAAGAVATALAAGAVWAIGGGCRLQGCPYGSYCNQKTGYCDVRRCEQGCPEGTICNEGLNRCQVAPPPQLPNDFLPQDDARNPPGTH